MWHAKNMARVHVESPCFQHHSQLHVSDEGLSISLLTAKELRGGDGHIN